MAKVNLDKEFLSSESDFVQDYVETGICGFDLAISDGKGLPIGGCILMYSAPGSGKSTLCADIAHRLLKKHDEAGLPYKCLYIDTEGGSRNLALNNGLAKYAEKEHGRRLLYRKSGKITWSDVETYYKAILDGDELLKDVKLVVIDSITAVMSAKQADEKAKITDGDFGSSAKDRNILFNKYMLDLKARGVTFILIAQQRQKQGALMYEDPKRAATADGDDHIVDCILKLSRSGGGNNAETKKVEVISAATGTKEKVSKYFHCKVEAPVKNRFCSGIPAIKLLVKIGAGIVNWYTIFSILTTYKLLKASGTKYNLCDELVTYIGENDPFVQGSDKKTTVVWVANHVDQIVEYLKSKNLYRASVEADLIESFDQADLGDDE